MRRSGGAARTSYVGLERWIEPIRRAIESCRARPIEVLFYAGSWIDEVWVRSAAFACRERGIPIALAVSGQEMSVESAILDSYRYAGISVYSHIEAAELQTLQTRVVVSATNGIAKKSFSPAVEHLVHMPHSIVSLHMIYTEDSFDGFDVLFAVGPHQMVEFDRLSSLHALVGRKAFPVGYGKLDLLLARSAHAGSSHRSEAVILVAPSWGPSNLLNVMGMELTRALLESSYRVVLRPHPLMVLGKIAALEAIVERFRHHERFSMEHPFGGDEAIYYADLVITDYSGMAMEFSILRTRPCVFVDVPKKSVNPSWERLGLTPVEVGFRGRLGELATPNVNEVLACVQRMLSQADDLAGKIAASGRELVYNIGHCGSTAADRLAELVAR